MAKSVKKAFKSGKKLIKSPNAWMTSVGGQGIDAAAEVGTWAGLDRKNVVNVLREAGRYGTPFVGQARGVLDVSSGLRGLMNPQMPEMGEDPSLTLMREQEEARLRARRAGRAMLLTSRAQGKTLLGL